MSDQPEPPDLEVEFDTSPGPSGLHVTRDGPYRILIVGDLAGGDEGTLQGALGKNVVSLAAPEALDRALAEARPSIRAKTTDPTVPGNRMVELELRFDSLRAFEPAGLVQQIPATRSLAALREALTSRLQNKTTPAHLNDAVARAVKDDADLGWVSEALKWSPAQASPPSEAVDDVLGALDLGTEEEKGPTPPGRSPIREMVAAAAGQAAIPPEEASAGRRALAEVDRRLGLWLNAVLHLPAVQRLESAWRSLAFLVSHVDFRKGVRLMLLHARRSELAERVRTRLIDPVFDEQAEAPDLIVVDAAFGNTAPDIEALDELAQHAASLPAILFASLAPQFFGVKFAWQVPTLPNFLTMFDQWQFAKWNALRNQPYARSLGAFFGRGLLRPPHHDDGQGKLGFAYREPCAADSDCVWVNGAVAAAVAAARSQADTGWPHAMAGMVHGMVGGLATAEGGKSGEKKIGPTDTILPESKVEEFAVAGINVVAASPGGTDAIVWNGLSAARPTRMEPGAFLQVSLPFQLLASRVSVLLLALKPHLAGLSAEQLVATVTRHACDWLGLSPDSLEDQLVVQARPCEDNPSALQLAVTLTPPQSILPGGIPVVLGYRLG